MVSSANRTMTDESGGPLSSAELDEFLAQPLLLKLACVRPDGWPYVIPLWYAWDAGKLYVVGRERAVWVDYIRREPRVGVLIDEDARRHRRVQMTATAVVVEGPIRRSDGSEHWQRLDRWLKARYMADEPGRSRQPRSRPGAAARGTAAITRPSQPHRRPPRPSPTDYRASVYD